jgi:hypothetical protein
MHPYREAARQQLQVFDECRDVKRLHVGKLPDSVFVARLRKTARGVHVRLARVVVVHLGGEKFQRAPGCLRCRREDRGRSQLGWGKG